jgi:hypothetical protein
VCFLGLLFDTEYGGSEFLLNVCKILPDYMASIYQKTVLIVVKCRENVKSHINAFHSVFAAP